MISSDLVETMEDKEFTIRTSKEFTCKNDKICVKLSISMECSRKSRRLLYFHLEINMLNSNKKSPNKKP